MESHENKSLTVEVNEFQFWRIQQIIIMFYKSTYINSSIIIWAMKSFFLWMF